MPIIRIDYDDKVVQNTEIQLLSKQIQSIVAKHTKIKEVFVYANTAEIKLNIDPIEIFIEMSAKINDDFPNLMQDIKNDLKEWKLKHNFSTPINLTIIPMQWQIEIAI